MISFSHCSYRYLKPYTFKSLSSSQQPLATALV